MSFNYQEPVHQVYRLLEEIALHGSLVVALDFDTTIYDCHNRDLDLQEVIDLMKEVIELEHKVFVFTANGDTKLVQDHCESIGLGRLPVNEPPIALDGMDSRKPFYSILLDDRAGLGEAVSVLRVVISNQKAGFSS